jgi:hypothetical protein
MNICPGEQFGNRRAVGWLSAHDNEVEAFVSVYVDMSASLEAVRAAVDQVAKPEGVTNVEIGTISVGDMFGCRIAVDLTGTFDEVTESVAIARAYAAELSSRLGVPAFAFYDLLRRDDRVS